MKHSLPPEEKRNKIICAYVCEAEYQQIVESSKRTGLTISDFGRRVLTGKEVKEVNEDIKNMIAAHSDLGKIEGLLKLAISEGHGSSMVYSILHKLNDTRQCLREKILAIE